MKTVRWGIIGCGAVTEVQSGPAYGQVTGFGLQAVMRRDLAKAEGYARRHGVPRWTDHAYIIMHTVQIDFPSNRLLSSGPNVLRFDPVYASASDYCWIGPAIVHFRQNA